MKAKSQQSEGREGPIDSEALIAAISETTNLADKVSCIPPAKIAFGSVTALLTLIRVCLLLLCYDLLQVHTQPGLNGQRTGLCWAWAILCRYLPRA